MRATAARPGAVWFSTVTPAYVDKTNATAIHAALRLPGDVIAADFGGAVRSGVAALRSALAGGPTTLLVSADVRTGLPGSADEAAGGDAGAALLVGDDADGEVIAEVLGAGSATDEFLDRWRTPGDARSKQWEEKFGETRYVPLAVAAFRAALADAGIESDQVDHLVVASTHARAAKAALRKLGVDGAKVADDLAGTVGNPGAAQPGWSRRHRAAGHRCHRQPRRDRSHRGTDRIRGSGDLRQVPGLAGDDHPRATPSTRAGPSLGLGGRP